MPNGWDHWWVVERDMTEQRATAVAADLGAALVNFGLPFMESLGDDRALRDRWLAEKPFLTPPEEDSLNLLIKAIGEH
jgi:hypothetical protein